MNRLWILFFLPMLSFQTDEPVSWFNGAYQQVIYPIPPESTASAQINASKVIRIFFEEHWAKIQITDQLAKLEGGVFGMKDGKAIPVNKYYLPGQGSSGLTDTYHIYLHEDQLQQKNLLKIQGEIDEEHFQRIQPTVPLKHKFIEGIWQLNGFALNSSGKADDVSGTVCLKYYVYPVFLIVKYASDGRIIGFAEGLYIYDYPTASISETVESSSLPEYRPGRQITSTITLHDNSFERITSDSEVREYWISATAK